MSFLKSLVVSFLTVLGSLTLLEELVEKIKRPDGWLRLDRSRRNFFILVISIVGGATIGISNWFRSERNKAARGLFEQLDVRLLQLEGLVATALGTQSAQIPHVAMAKLMEYIGDYWRRTNHLVRELQPYMEEREFLKMRSSLLVLQNGTVAVQQQPTGERRTSILTAMLDAIGGMRTIIRTQLGNRARSDA